MSNVPFNPGLVGAYPVAVNNEVRAVIVLLFI
jgi:hypothetical protein